jgi:molybdopterin-containing oxidoreductase family membrane subunit
MDNSPGVTQETRSGGVITDASAVYEGTATSSAFRPRLVQADRNLSQVTEDVARHVGVRPTATWWVLLALALTALTLGTATTIYQMATGIGTWGLNRTVGWGFDITNFVFWIGIGHAGTLISAILYLFRQQWRTSINRAAEAMTIFAVLCAAIFPIIHMGRPWLFYWVLPYPNTRGSLWVNFRSPLLWDFFAISTYFLISLTFWYMGMVPDLATLRDRATGWVKRRIWRPLSLGWNGSHRVWHRYETMYALLAALATPLVVSVHSIVSMDFATSIVPGWHSTLFPPYFVAGAVFSGMAMVLVLLIITRKAMALESYITVDHLERMTKVILLTSGIVALAYLTELFTAWYSGNPYERFAFANRATGPYGWAYWVMMLCNVAVPQLLWIRRVRRSVPAIFGIAILINVGMWFERFVIIVTSLHRDYLPSSWAMYTPTFIEIATFIGTFGLFFTLFLLFIRFLPVIAISEVKGAMVRDNRSLTAQQLRPPNQPKEVQA